MPRLGDRSWLLREDFLRLAVEVGWESFRGCEVAVVDFAAAADLGNVFVAAWRARIRLADRIAAQVGGEPAEPRVIRSRYAKELEHLAERTRDICIAVIDHPSGGGALPEVKQQPLPAAPPPGSAEFGVSNPPADYGGKL